MNQVISIFGPTTSNKLGLALNLAKYIFGKFRIDSEIINVDSRKIYKGFEISQSLFQEDLLKNVKTHLYRVISPQKEIDLFDFQELVKDKINEIHKRKAIPILVGGSTLHMLSVLENWTRGETDEGKSIPKNILVLGISIPRKTLRRAIDKNVERMFDEGLYEEFKSLYRESREDKVSLELLNKTHGYRQFLEMARVSQTDPLNLPQKSEQKIKHWMKKDIAKFAYLQELDFKRFKGIKIVKDFEQARRYVDKFLNHKKKT